MGDPIKVAIVGGGCAGVATAFELTRPEHGGKFAVTLYQQGWRLGGKGASGRRAPDQRIEEHGLHLWMGFYENAFAMMRECYAEAARDPGVCPLATWDQAFRPDNFVGVTEKTGPGAEAWQNWTAWFPPASGNPGDPLKSADPFTIPGYLARCALMLTTLITSVQDRLPEGGVKGADDLAGAINVLVRSTVAGVRGDPQGSLKRLASYGQLALSVAVAEALDILRNLTNRTSEDWRAAGAQEQASSLLARLSALAHAQIEMFAQSDTEIRRVWEIADVVLAIMRGIIRDGLIFNPLGFDAIDHMDWRDWLRKHGASKSSVESAFIRGSYDLLFAYEGGDLKKPRLAAGQALRGALRMFFTYRGALFWKMQAGMGDVVFAPFYEVLKARGVEFRFFHRLERIGLSADGGHVAELEMSRQAALKGDSYDPLIDVGGVPSWPAEPLMDQLDGDYPEGWDAESRWDDHMVDGVTLRVKDDFDYFVLATGLGEIETVGAELIEANRDWRRMLEEVGTVATQALQVWMKDPVDRLGWTLPPINISGYVEPFDTWADMSHLIAREAWEGEIGSVAYFCSVLPDSEIAGGDDPRAATHDHVRASAIRFLERDVGHFWPEVVDAEGFRWDRLATAPGDADKTGPDRIDTQFWTANINPSDRYVLSLPGTLKYRISPLDRHFDNMTVAGDWTRCGHQAGCVEAAVMSGRLAAHALSLSPPLEEIVGYDHP